MATTGGLNPRLIACIRLKPTGEMIFKGFVLRIVWGIRVSTNLRKPVDKVWDFWYIVIVGEGAAKKRHLQVSNWPQ